MLEDKDRIFTNLYGMHDRSLKGAMERGHWDGTAGLIQRGREAIVEEMKSSGLRGRGAILRRGLVMSETCLQHDGPVGGHDRLHCGFSAIYEAAAGRANICVRED